MSTALAATNDAGALALPALADRINEEHQLCESAMQAGLEHGMEAGRLLLQAKKTVGHGEWLPWLEANFRGSRRTAQAYMRVARQLPKLNGNATPVALLTFRGALSAMASNSQKIAATPEAEAHRGQLASVVDRVRERFVEEEADALTQANDNDLPEGVSRGVGVIKANEAVDCLRRIPKNDRLRKRGFQIVMDWIRRAANSR